jgi:alpha-amylase
MMKQICLIFHTHQPVRLKNYRFYEIGGNNSYFNEEYNQNWLTKTANKKFIPVNKVLSGIFNNPELQFKVSFSFSGSTLDLFEAFTPNLIENLKMMNQRGNVEFLGETYTHISSEKSSHEDFVLQIENQKKKLFNLFGQIPRSFRNNGMYCNSFLSSFLPDLGYKVLLNHSPEVFVSLSHKNTSFHFPERPNIKLLFGNKEIAQAIENPKAIKGKNKAMTADMLTTWINNLSEEENIVTLYIDYSAFIKDQSPDMDLLDFLRELPKKAKAANIGFITPVEISNGKKFTSSPLPMPSVKLPEKEPIKNIVDLQLQQEIYNLLFSLKEKVYQTNNDSLIKTWYYLQDNSHFRTWEQKESNDQNKEDFQETIGTYITLRNILQDLSFKVDHLLEEKKPDFGNTFRLSDQNFKSFQNETFPNQEKQYVGF